MSFSFSEGELTRSYWWKWTKYWLDSLQEKKLKSINHLPDTCQLLLKNSNRFIIHRYYKKWRTEISMSCCRMSIYGKKVTCEFLWCHGHSNKYMITLVVKFNTTIFVFSKLTFFCKWVGNSHLTLKRAYWTAAIAVQVQCNPIYFLVNTNISTQVVKRNV